MCYYCTLMNMDFNWTATKVSIKIYWNETVGLNTKCIVKLIWSEWQCKLQYIPYHLISSSRLTGIENIGSAVVVYYFLLCLFLTYCALQKYDSCRISILICCMWRHSDAMIHRLEHSGLGYHIEAHQTADKLGRWHLTYRVCIYVLKIKWSDQVEPF